MQEEERSQTTCRQSTNDRVRQVPLGNQVTKPMLNTQQFSGQLKHSQIGLPPPDPASLRSAYT